MMGIKARTFAPICNLSLKMLVPAEHFYRYVDARLDLGFARDLVRLRGLWKANVDALLIATGQKLKRLLRKRGWGRRPCQTALWRRLWRVDNRRARSAYIYHSLEVRVTRSQPNYCTGDRSSEAGFFNILGRYRDRWFIKIRSSRPRTRDERPA
jgi:hypothetical protein